MNEDRDTTGGLDPELGKKPVLLIVGSYPSPISLERREYYANPRNQFWQIIEGILRIDHELPYCRRIRHLNDHHVALWDMVMTCTRAGASDSHVRDPVLNDIPGLLRAYPSIRRIAANGSLAGRFLVQSLYGCLTPAWYDILPSSSPANASLPIDGKIARWKPAFAVLQGDESD